MSIAAREFVERKIAENAVILFVKNWCPYCKKAEATIKNLVDQYEKIDLVKMAEGEPAGSDIQEYLYTKTQQSTVPNIFIRQQHIGGNDRLQELVANKSIRQYLEKL
ncbi:6750_t:CDS:2 [Paraglomus brasilianum]|uniref:6750_t:CDS:1 n=1 Tax=Paraglomus brasilianum TaxID=144538 RepID=A0A9N9GMV2_9GLOM|nr:6750_t:CDS:2 [Paraglomus brasilianum]